MNDDDQILSPSERYSRFKARQATPAMNGFADAYGFSFDDFQTEACKHIEAGSGVLVAAPTGAGKTIAGEFAVYLALEQGRKCFYTTPIKALSNQKYADLVARHGSDNVGLLTGDSSINSNAPVVVMTTEVLRNMLYANSSTLTNLGYVVMDEVHYLADRFRGAVWEEVIIGLADSVQIVALSATVSNAEEFGDWLSEVRGGMAVVVSERRPVPLYQHVLAGRQVYDLFADDDPTAKADVNPQLVSLARSESRAVRDDSRRPRGRNGKGKKHGTYGSGAYGGGASHEHRSRSKLIPSRSDAVETLSRADLLPAIFFIFSRIGCDMAVKQLMQAGARLTNSAERREITDIVNEHIDGLSHEDLLALEYPRFFEALKRGVAAHHAGMLPAFKEAVEECFLRGLCKVVFATETLALGINMPARSVVLEKLVKYNGETHADISPGEYTQLTGRAGRRGIDVEGHAVVLWQPGLDPRAVAGLASKRTYPLKSSFAPTYNMSVNLVGAVGRDRARVLLEQSFAQFQTDRSVVGMARSMSKNDDAIAKLRSEAECERGDFMAYATIRSEIARIEADAARNRKSDKRAESLQAMLGLERGDVVSVPGGKSSGWAVVIEPGTGDRDAPRPLVMTEDKQVRRLSLTDFPSPPNPATRIRVPKQFDPKQAAAKRNLHAAMRSRLNSHDGAASRYRAPMADEEAMAQIARLREQLRDHPCHECPDREKHARIAERALGLERDVERLERRVSSRTNTIANQFDKICLVLESLGYLGEGGNLISDQGRMLARIYNELDLVAAECLRRGVFDDLSGPELAAVLSALVYQARRSNDRDRSPRMPTVASEDALSRLRKTWREVSMLEADHRLPRGPEPDIGFAVAAYRWTDGAELSDVLDTSGLTAGDFVRWIRQVIDFADQIAAAAGSGPIRTNCRRIVDDMRRGVVSFQTEAG